MPDDLKQLAALRHRLARAGRAANDPEKFKAFHNNLLAILAQLRQNVMMKHSCGFLSLPSIVLRRVVFFLISWRDIMSLSLVCRKLQHGVQAHPEIFANVFSAQSSALTPLSSQRMSLEAFKCLVKVSGCCPLQLAVRLALQDEAEREQMLSTAADHLARTTALLVGPMQVPSDYRGEDGVLDLGWFSSYGRRSACDLAAWRSMRRFLIQPAPVLRRLHVHSTTSHSGNSHFLPTNLFSGHAAQLRSCSLHKVTLPDGPIPVLTALEELHYHPSLMRLHGDELDSLFGNMPRLVTLHLDVFSFQPSDRFFCDESEPFPGHLALYLRNLKLNSDCTCIGPLLQQIYRSAALIQYVVCKGDARNFAWLAEVNAVFPIVTKAKLLSASHLELEMARTYGGPYVTLRADYEDDQEPSTLENVLTSICVDHIESLTLHDFLFVERPLTADGPASWRLQCPNITHLHIVLASGDDYIYNYSTDIGSETFWMSGSVPGTMFNLHTVTIEHHLASEMWCMIPDDDQRIKHRVSRKQLSVSFRELYLRLSAALRGMSRPRLHRLTLCGLYPVDIDVHVWLHRLQELADEVVFEDIVAPHSHQGEWPYDPSAPYDVWLK
ncbi:hypothetical protein BKA62DRAFT_831535 [Auriculariales sp. MPI-PUGE-AT-0066]|nr:hypothetical protein BKA62DRAFT_831535 [Auriculariales sp. MPI-PUGE-AT-0066]